MSYDCSELVGHVIVGVDIAKDKGAIRFRLEDGEQVYRADGDCCSHTWIERLERPEVLIGERVTGTEGLDMPHHAEEATPEQEDEYGGDVIAYYGLRIDTAKGSAIIDYRNASNGYYGGSLVGPDATRDYAADNYFYGGVFGQNVSREEWEPVL